MRRPAIGWMLAVVAALALGCERAPEEREKESESIAERQGVANPFEESELESIAREWQGNWVVDRFDEKDAPYAWNISGEEISIFWSTDGETGQEHGRFEVVAPCAARAVNEDELDRDGGHDVRRKTLTRVLFAFGSDQRYATYGLSPTDVDHAGVVTDGGFTLCIGGSKVVTFDEAGCKWWSYDAAFRPPKKIECSLSDASAEVETPEGEYLTVERRGDLLLGDDIAPKKLKSFPSFDEAKSAIQ